MNPNEPRSEAEVRATARRFHTRAKSIRSLLADPGDDCEGFRPAGVAIAQFHETLATELEAVAAD